MQMFGRANAVRDKGCRQKKMPPLCRGDLGEAVKDGSKGFYALEKIGDLRFSQA
jgi:hypothetical protein